MRIYDIITKKKAGAPLTQEEIQFVVDGFTNGTIPDYQMSALLMAICFKGMDKQETANLTMAMAHSGDTVDLSMIEGIKVDKHSTGGVGDKTTLIISPIVASFGVPIAKMSGRGLGHTGGTVDKLESIPGLKTAMSRDEFLDIVKRVGACVAGQSGNLAPADKKIYALRDVTATVDSIPLIAASIMSKKIAAGADCIVLDVKTGSGAFMKTKEDAIQLAQAMVDIGESVGRKCVALITDMDIPLGSAIGNALEIIEVVNTLRGKGPKDLTEICVYLATEMLCLAGKGTHQECETMVKQAIESKSAYQLFLKMIQAQGGDIRYIENLDLFHTTNTVYELLSLEEGYITHMDTEGFGIASVMLGAGREKEDSPIDYSAGIVMKRKTGDYVKAGDVLAYLHTSDESKLPAAKNKILSSVVFGEKAPEAAPLVMAKVDSQGVTYY